MTRHRRRPSVPAALALAVLALAGCGDSSPAGLASGRSSNQELPSAASGVLDDEAVAQTFFDAVVAGDRSAGAAVATEAALAVFDPWSRHPSYSVTAVVDGTFFINPGTGPIRCTVVAGRVTGCLAAPSGDAATTDLLQDPTKYATYRELPVVPGGAPMSVEGSVVSGAPRDGYVVPSPGGAGEQLDITVSTREGNATFSVFGPDDTRLASDVRELHLELSVAGDYLVVVGPTRGNATYTLSVGVSVDAS